MKYGDGLIQVLTAPLIDPAAGRIDINVPDGLTLREIVGIALPALGPDDFQSLRVALVTERGSELVDPRFWSRVKPRPGVHVVIRVVPGKNALRSILSIVVAVCRLLGDHTGNRRQRRECTHHPGRDCSGKPRHQCTHSAARCEQEHS